MRQLPLGISLRVSARFSTYLAGPNEGAVRSLQSLRRALREPPLWLCGPAGAGKTHLLQAACAAAGVAGGRALYLPLAERDRFAPGMLEGAEDLDALLLDDLDAVAGDEGWEHALFAAYNELQEAGGRLVVAAAGPPALTGWQLPDLRSRLSASTLHALRLLPESLHGDALLARAGQLGLELAQEPLTYLLRHGPRSFARLCEVLDEVDRASLANQRKVTVPLIRQVMGHGHDVLPAAMPPPPQPGPGSN